MIKKAVLPVAGFGTRFLPASKATPKEMLPIIDKPLVQYAVEEAIDIGIEEIIFITSDDKFSIKKHFERNEKLEKRLVENNKEDFVDKLIGLEILVRIWKSRSVGLGVLIHGSGKAGW